MTKLLGLPELLARGQGREAAAGSKRRPAAGFLSLPWIAIAPISSSSGSDVIAVFPEFSVVAVVPVAFATLSTGAGDTNPLKVKNEAAMLTLAVEATVIVPFESAVVTGAEKTSVLIPLVPVPAVWSALFVYVFPALSLTVMVDAVASTAIVAKIVLPAATVIPV